MNASKLVRSAQWICYGIAFALLTGLAIDVFRARFNDGSDALESITAKAENTKPNIRWEYRTIEAEVVGTSVFFLVEPYDLSGATIKRPDDERYFTTLDSMLNHMGSKGWELVSRVPSSGQKTQFNFKRQR